MDTKLRELVYRLVAMAPEAPPFPEEPMVQLKPAKPPAPPARRRSPVVWLAAAAAVTLLVVGIPLFLSRGDTTPTVPPATDPTVPGEETPTTVLPVDGSMLQYSVYLYADDVTTSSGDPALVAVARVGAIESDSIEERLFRALQSLITDPVPAGLSSAIPPGIGSGATGAFQPELDGGFAVGFSDGIVAFDVDPAFLAEGDSEELAQRRAQVVFTATQFPEVDGVRFLGNGVPMDEEPLTRERFFEVSQAIYVDAPGFGATVASPLRIAGTANVFEATLQYEIVTDAGDALASGFTTATCGSGCWGDFEVTESYDLAEDTTGVVDVFVYSAEDGSRQNVISYPVTLLATSEPPTPTAAAIDLRGQPWVEGRPFVGVFGADGAELATVELQVGVKPIAWDGGDGLVYLTSENHLRWITPAGDTLVTELDARNGFPTLLDVVVVDGRPLAAIAGVDDTGSGMTWIDVTNREVAAGPADRFTLGDRFEISAAGRTAYVEEPDWSDIPRGEAGELIPPFPLPQLVVVDAEGAELLRAEIGTEARPFAVLHDFDGRRIIYSVEPGEPALAPRTVTILDLECAACTQTVESDAGAAWFELVGDAPPKVAGDCSAAGLDVALVDQPELPGPVGEMRQAIYQAAMACDIPALAELANAGDVPFNASFGGQDAATYWSEGEAQGETILADLVRHLNQPVGVDERTDPTFYVWPSAHGAVSLDEIPAEDYAALLELYSAEELENMYDVIGGYVGWRIGIDATGDWRYFVAGD